jgi:hypothetical protein
MTKLDSKLAEYLDEQRGFGTTQEQLAAELRKGGWSEAAIQDALASTEALRAKKTVYRNSIGARILRGIGYAIGLLLFLGLVGTAGYGVYLLVEGSNDIRSGHTDRLSEKELVDYAAIHAVEIQSALGKYKADTGSYPDALFQLAPKYLQNIPQNPVTHTPYLYSKDPAAGYQLCAQLPRLPEACTDSHATLNGKSFTE